MVVMSLIEKSQTYPEYLKIVWRQLKEIVNINEFEIDNILWKMKKIKKTATLTRILTKRFKNKKQKIKPLGFSKFIAENLVPFKF